MSFKYVQCTVMVFSTYMYACIHSYAVVVDFDTFYATMKTHSIKELSGDMHVDIRGILCA